MPRTCVVNASFTLRTLLPNSLRQAALERLADLGRQGTALCAPTLWYYEVTSALTKLVHFAQVKQEEAYLALAESRGLEMWTADKKLHGAVSRPWLHLLA